MQDLGPEAQFSPGNSLQHLTYMRAESSPSLATTTPLWPSWIHLPSLGRLAHRAAYGSGSRP